MTYVFRNVSAALAAGVALFFIGCSAGCSAQVGAGSAAIPAPANRASALRPQGPRSGYLYVASQGLGLVSVFAANATTPLRTINDGTGQREPAALAFGRNGELYVAGANFESPQLSQIRAYAPGTAKLLRTISRGITVPDYEIFDAKGNLYVANRPVPTSQIGGPPATPAPPGAVAVYPPAGVLPIRTIADGISGPASLAFDPSGNLYVANCPTSNSFGGTVTVYAPGSTTPMRTISLGIHRPAALAFDRRGDLYVANIVSPRSGDVTVYGPRANTPAYTIRQGIGVPGALAFDRAGDLYVANVSIGQPLRGRISVYAIGAVKPLRTISTSTQLPNALTFDPDGNLYVAQAVDNEVAVYAPGTAAPARTIATNLPFALTFGP